MSEGKPPANYWATVIAAGSLALAALNMLMNLNKSDAEETQALRDRMCRLEGLMNAGDCKK